MRVTSLYESDAVLRRVARVLRLFEGDERRDDESSGSHFSAAEAHLGARSFCDARPGTLHSALKRGDEALEALGRTLTPSATKHR